MFQELDENGDGKLSKEEILNGYEKAFGVPIEEDDVDKMFKEIDIDERETGKNNISHFYVKTK